MIRAAILCAFVLPGAAFAAQATSMPRGELRVLDKVTGQTTDFVMAAGQSETIGSLTITMNDCRVPADNPTGDAYAELTVTNGTGKVPVFAGWMIASAPALNAMDHPHYDVWVMRCRAT